MSAQSPPDHHGPVADRRGGLAGLRHPRALRRPRRRGPAAPGLRDRRRGDRHPRRRRGARPAGALGPGADPAAGTVADPARRVRGRRGPRLARRAAPVGRPRPSRLTAFTRPG
ncbi:Exonuclease SbcC [Streptomyces misionensis JCM 4497]